MPKPLRLALVNDYDLIISGLRSMLEPFADRVEVVEMNANTHTLSKVDIALFDAFGPTENSQHQLDELIEDPTINRVVYYTWLTDEAAPHRLPQEGTSGVLCKSLSATELVDSLERIAAGEVVVTPAQTVEDAPPSAPSNRDWPGRSAGLTMREAEMVSMITKGLSNVEIAELTFLSPNSIKSYIRSAYRKIGVQRRSQAVAWGMRNGMIEDVTRKIIR